MMIRMATSLAGWVLLGIVCILFMITVNKSNISRVICEETTVSRVEKDAPAMQENEEIFLRKSERREEILNKLIEDNVSADDPKLIKAIRDYVLEAPRPYVFKHSFPLFLTPQAQRVHEILNFKKNGFFIECGGLDGERSSNTIVLENQHGWTGLLVEVDPSWYLQMRGKNRRSYTANVCLSTSQNPMKTYFQEHSMGSGKLVDKPGGRNVMITYCLPIYTLMLAMNRTKIDFFSLDVEGFEVPILKSIPWDKLDISVLAVEYIHGDKQQYVSYMESVGYRVHSEVIQTKVEINLYAHDFIFVKKDLKL